MLLLGPICQSRKAPSADVLATTWSGCVIAVGSDDDVLTWFALLPSYPNLELLTLSMPVIRLMAMAPNASSQG